jgi:hypothetical protein
VPDLSADSRAKLTENLLAMALVDTEHPWTENGLLITEDSIAPPLHAMERGLGGEVLHISLSPAAATHLDNRTLVLAAVNAGQVGTAYISSIDTNPVLSAHAVFDLPPNTPPDPTIAGAVDFITREARRYQNKN